MKTQVNPSKKSTNYNDARRYRLIFILIILVYFQSYAQESLTITNVNSWWWQEQAEIDNATFTIQPKGLYAECKMELEFSALNTTFDPADSLEVRMKFTLPCKSQVTDLLLWVEDTLMQAGIYDRWTANQLYESIVQRRIDPALLVQNGPEQYELSIFPIMINMPRKVVVSYLTPINNYGNKNPSLSLPLNIFKLTKSETDSVVINYIPVTDLDILGLEDYPQATFSQQIDPNTGMFYKTVITNINSFNSLQLDMIRSSQNSSFLGSYVDTIASQSYYQLSIEPGQTLGASGTSKAVFLLDYVEGNSNSIDPDELLSGLQSELLEMFDSYDSINIMYSGLYTNYVSNEWISADSLSVAQIFGNVPGDYSSSFSNLPMLIADGINFIQAKGGEGSIVLITNGNSDGNYTEANSIVQAVQSAIISDNISIHVVDLDDNIYGYGNKYYYIGGRYYKGNEYLYLSLTASTVGEYMSIRDNTYKSMLTNSLARLSGFFSALDIYTTLQSGFTFSNYKLGCNAGVPYYDLSFTQTGKYVGNGQFDIFASAQLDDGQILSVSLSLDSTVIYPLDKTAKTIWTGQKIEELLTYNLSNQIIDQAISQSIESRTLCRYTAFLALEPSMQLSMVDQDGNLIVNSTDAGGNPTFPTSIEEPAEDIPYDGLFCEFFPNPVVNFSTVRFIIPHAGNVQIRIYNMHGSLLTTLADHVYQRGTHELEFDTRELPAGIYYYILVWNGTESTVKKIAIQ